MLAGLLPDSVHSHEVFSDVGDARLFPEELAALAGAVEKRVREFTTARHCARRALAALGLPPAPIVPGPHREPQWPSGTVGSLTHCAGYRAAAVARADEFASVGIDAEPHAPVPDDVLDLVARPEERDRLQRLRRAAPGTHWDRLLFSAKEAVYKAWFPLVGEWLDFDQASVRLSPEGGFTADLLVPGPALGGERRLTGFTGRWVVGRGIVLATIAQTWPAN